MKILACTVPKQPPASGAISGPTDGGSSNGRLARHALPSSLRGTASSAGKPCTTGCRPSNLLPITYRDRFLANAWRFRPARQHLAPMVWSIGCRVSGSSSLIVRLWCIERRVAHFFAVPFLATPAFAIGVDQAGIGATAARVIRHQESCYSLSAWRYLDAAASKPSKSTVTKIR